VSRDEELAARFGTPLYVYDVERAAAARRDLSAALPDGFTLFYSLKANPHPEIARALREDGDGSCRAELSSLGELSSALDAGYAADECLYTGPGKTSAEIAIAIERGVRMFSVESLTDLRRVGDIAGRRGVVVDCLLRINSAASSASTSIRMTGTPSQFGFDVEALGPQVAELTGVPGTRVAGTHFFPLSNSKDEASLIGEFQDSIATAARLRDEFGLPMRFLDIGGGFAAPYASPGTRPVYEKLRVELENTLDLYFPQWRSGTPEVACESGRYLVGDCGELLCSVTNIKESRGHKFIIVDAGINTLGGMSGLGRLLPLAIKLDGEDAYTEAEIASLVGPLCTPGDILGRNIELPTLEIGDVITVPNVGAYGPTASLLLFLSRPAPREVILRGADVVSVSQLEVRRTYAA
jgi:diaminopimelate decarboxylase